MTSSAVDSVIQPVAAVVPQQTEDVQRETGSLAFAVARALLGAILLACPLAFGAVEPWSWTALALLAVLLLVLWGVGCVERGVLRILWSPLYLPAALFLLLGAIQLFGRLTPDPIATRESLLKLVTYLIFFFLGGELLAGASEKPWRAVSFIALIYAFLLSLFAIVQFFSSPGLIYWSVKPRWGGWVFGPYVNHNHYAGLMELLIPVGAGYVLSRPKDHPARALLAFAVLVPVASVLLSGSRGGSIALLAESFILIVILLGSARGQRMLASTVVLVVTAATLTFFWMDTGEISQRLATVFQIPHSTEVSFGGRKIVALDSLRILCDHPWLGTGLGSFATVYPYYQSLPSDEVWDHAHNDYAEALAETGIVGGALILSALAIFFHLALRNFRDRLRQEEGWVQLGAALGCCGLLVHSLFDFNLHIPANAVWFGLCAALATCGSQERAISGQSI